MNYHYTKYNELDVKLLLDTKNRFNQKFLTGFGTVFRFLGVNLNVEILKGYQCLKQSCSNNNTIVVGNCDEYQMQRRPELTNRVFVGIEHLFEKFVADHFDFSALVSGHKIIKSAYLHLRRPGVERFCYVDSQLTGQSPTAAFKRKAIKRLLSKEMLLPFILVALLFSLWGLANVCCCQLPSQGSESRSLSLPDLCSC